MSKRKEKKPTLADWEIVIDRGEDSPPGTQTVERARWRRDERGYHTFRDHEGIVAEFAPGVVLSVRRLKTLVPDPHARALAAEAARTELAAKRTNGERG